MSKECAASHPEIDPWGQAWAETETWDTENANWQEVDDREPDLHRAIEATDASDTGDLATAIKIWHGLAERGSVRAMIELGICHEFGCGVPLNPDLAEDWYNQAASGGSQFAMLRRAHLAASRNDYAESDAILQAGVDAGWASAIFWQAWYRIKQSGSKECYRRTYPLLKLAAKLGHPGAKLVLANLTVRGKFGRLRVPFGLVSAAKLVIDVSVQPK